MHLDPAMLDRVQRSQSYQAPSLTRLEGRVRLYHEVAPWQRAIKRAFDVFFSVLGLSLFALLLPALAVLIKLDSRGGVFYSQERIGINRRGRDRRGDTGKVASDRRDPERRSDRRKILQEGRSFKIYKLRTMYSDSESDGVRWAEKGDSRITRVGKILRQTRLDEFPQFWNVLLGEMSIVGPRPERPPFITLLSGEVPGYLNRLRFKPGITGLAQVENGYDDSIESVHRKVELDVRYMANFNLLLDIKILLKSVKVVLTGQGAF